ncbi:hypothetical protein QR680_019235 [Steinernema hermaphroditum]|uniref:Uncharacterized protein n=1 Tax=Steinernema hermaphroditum TaxID=289476 RepID=A0AA39HMM0_9BILA|nr:hypothetical protein QR680_019235 [Steinernema hermaphroditum]
MGCCGGSDQVYISPHFSENSPRYRVCCGLMHITTYAGFIAFTILIRSAAIFATAWLFTQLDPTPFPEAEQISAGFFIYGCISLLCLLLFACGLFTRNAYSIVPFVTLMVFETAILLIFTTFAVYWFYNGTRFAEIDNFVKFILEVLKESGFNANVAVHSLSEPIHMAIIGFMFVGLYIYTDCCRTLIACTAFFVDIYRYNRKRAANMIYGAAPRLGECEYSIDG